jgi:hypothetical protein
MSTNTDGTSSDTATETLSLAAFANCIDNPRRRTVIRLVGDCPVGSGYKVGELSRDLAAAENDKSRVSVTGQERKRAYVSLYQSHIDALGTAGIVGVREDGDVLVCTEATKQALDALETLDILLGDGGDE